MTTPTRETTVREVLVARAVFLAVGYFKNPDRETLVRLAREYYDADHERTAVDVAYLVVRNYKEPLV